jgi:predicted Rossmann fold flavoprotein
MRGGMTRYDVAIIGAGAAGMFAAVEAGRRGRRVIVVDHAARPGEKIRISGGGRCNFTNREAPADRFLSQNTRFALSALRRFTPQDFVERVGRAGIAWHEKTLGQLFCDGSAKQIVAMLTEDMRATGCELWLSTTVGRISGPGPFRIETSGGVIEATSLIVATGGKSIPKMGATGLGYQIAQQFGLRLTPTRPALVALTFGPQDLARTAPLAGVAVEARVTCGKIGFDEGMLFTHRGLSGPSILQISSYWREGDMITVDLARGRDIAAELRSLTGAGKLAIRNALARLLPERVAALVAEGASVSGTLGDQSKASLARIADAAHRWQLRPVGTEGYRTAEVTLGGVDTDDLDARTLQARNVPGLYFVGEVVDVTGWLGGYNFQWAWSSAWAAGQVA